MITYFQAAVLGLLQGVSELFPVSSLGHSVILPRLLHWSLNQQDPFFLTFLVATHTATALVLLGFFWQDWVRIVRGMGYSLKARDIQAGGSAARLGWLLVVGTIPAGLLGLLFQDPLRALFASATITALFLLLNGVVLWVAELLRRKVPEVSQVGIPDERIARISWGKAVGIGTAQSIALIPGFSRSGAAMAGGLLSGLSHEDAARFSFLLATPIIGAAALLKLPSLLDPSMATLRGPAVVGAVCSGVAAYLAVRFLLRFFETNRLTPFALYCVLAGATASLYLLQH